LGASGCQSDLRKNAGNEKEGAAAPTLGAVGDEAVVVLDSATVSRIGLRTMTLERATRTPMLELSAVIVDDPGAGTTVRAGIGGRLTAADGGRWPAVGQRLEAGTEIAQVGDARAVTVPRGGSVTRLLAQPGELVQAGQPLLELTDYSSPLARLAWGASEVAPPAEIGFRQLSGGATVQGRLAGTSPQADPVTGGIAYLYRVGQGGSRLRPGAALVALVPDQAAPRRGVELPSAAVVQWDALAWAYVQRAPGKFARVPVSTDHPVPGGWRVEDDLHPGDRVVVAGAGQLLSEEFRARIVVGEEVGE
jgi:hypothetical protein